MRIVALLLAVALIVISGFWLARDRSSGAGAGTQAAAESSEQPGGGQGEADEPQSGEDAGADEQAAEQSGPLPEGYEPVEYLAEEPRRVFDAAEEVLAEGHDYVAVVRTNKGDIVVDLFEDRTPQTVNSFVFLALNRYYEHVPFHRVIEGFMAQTGDPTGTGTGGPGYQFEDEIVEGLGFERRGLLAMANAGPGTNGSQFFFTFDATPWLNGAHTIFGEILQGEAVLDEITRVDPQQPSAVAMTTETLDELRAKGVDLQGEGDQTVESAIEELLGTAPVAGQSFTVAGYRGVLGAAGGEPAYGFFLEPDEIQSVIVGVRPDAD
ncbi:MAG TPA: peptidylprolyl isomerase [Trueperaceae bacterium]|nr:peptidylprolyl isomerase [Trueperaceae bacterium]